MLNTLPDCRDHSVPEILNTSPGLTAKVGSEGKLLPFPGNTVVFLLDEDVKASLQRLQEELYQRCGKLLAEPLRLKTFHMTLHDLANGNCLDQRAQMAAQAAGILDTLRRKPVMTIPMKAVCTFNMVNTSIVLLLEPVNEQAWQQLDDLYLQLQQVRELPYALTPHITLAYFRPGCYAGEETEVLRSALRHVDLELSLSTGALVLQDFESMNDYRTVY